MDLEILDGDILDAVRQNLGLDSDDPSRDKYIASMEKMEIFERYLTWHGFIGYAQELWDAVETIREASHFE